MCNSPAKEAGSGIEKKNTDNSKVGKKKEKEEEAEEEKKKKKKKWMWQIENKQKDDGFKSSLSNYIKRKWANALIKRQRWSDQTGFKMCIT